LRSKWTAGKGSVSAGRRIGVSASQETRFRNVWQGTRSRAIRGSTSDDRVGCSASDGRCAPARPAQPRRSMSRRVFCRFCHPRSRVPMVFGPFHYCAFCEGAAPETIDDQRRCTGCRYRTIYGGSRGSASLRASEVARSYQLHTNASTLTETKAFESEVLIDEGK